MIAQRRAIAMFTADPSLFAGLGEALAALEIDARAWNPGDPLYGDTIIGIADQWDCEHDEALHAAATSASASSMRVGLDGDRIWVGPFVRPHASGCSRCARAWLRNNHPQRQSWDAMFVTDPARARAGQFPRVVFDAIAAVLADALERVASNELDRSIVVVDTSTGSTMRHRFFPVPECERCSTTPADSAERAEIRWKARPKVHPRSYRAANPLLDLASLERRTIDWRCGLVKHLFQDSNSTLLPMAVTEQPIVDEKYAVEAGYGRAETVEQSRRVAILETLERFVGHRARRALTRVRGSAKKIGEAGIDPRHYILHASDQRSEAGFAYPAYSDDLEYDWVWGYSFRRGKPVLVPEQLVYYRLQPRGETPINRFVYESSSGCALGGNLEEATFYGLLEVIERDAYLTTWYGRFTPTALDPSDAVDPNVHALIARAEGDGYRIHLFDMGMEFGVPTIWAMIVDPRPNAPVKSYCASAAHPDPERAIFSALVEVTTSMGVYSQSMPPLRERARTLFNDPSLLQSMSDHVLLYSLEETMPLLSFLFDSRPAVGLRTQYRGWYELTPPSDLLVDLTRLVERVMTCAHDVVVVNQTWDGLDEFGLSAVRVLAPGLLPVTFGHQYRRVSLDRVNQAGRARNVAQIVDARTINPYPHNFP